MGRKRRVFTDKFKAKVALEAIKGVRSAAQLATEYQLHPNQITQWKKQLISQASEIFGKGNKVSKEEREDLKASLYEEIGRLKMDIKWLEKKL